MRKLLLRMTGLKFIPYSSIFHQFAGHHWKDTKLKSCLFSGFGCQRKPVEEESLSQMVTKVRTHPSLFSSFKNSLCTKIKHKEGSPFSKKQENQMEKPSIKLNIPKSVWEVKISSVISRHMCNTAQFSPPSSKGLFNIRRFQDISKDVRCSRVKH